MPLTGVSSRVAGDGFAVSVTTRPGTGLLFASFSVTVMVACATLLAGMLVQSVTTVEVAALTVPTGPPVPPAPKVTVGRLLKVTEPADEVAMMVKVTVCGALDRTWNETRPLASEVSVGAVSEQSLAP